MCNAHPQPFEAKSEANVNLVADGEGYAQALLDRIGAGVSSPDDLAELMAFLHSGPMLHAACSVLYLALRSVYRQAERVGFRDR